MLPRFDSGRRLTTKDLKYLAWTSHGAKLFSKCAKRQYMAVVVGVDGRVLGTGYNGAPPSITECVDGGCPRLMENSPSGSPYDNCISVHAEANALLYSDRTARMRGCLYVNGQPCWDCGKLLAGSGLARVVTLIDAQYEDAGRVNQLMTDAGLVVIQVDKSDLDELR